MVIFKRSNFSYHIWKRLVVCGTHKVVAIMAVFEESVLGGNSIIEAVVIFSHDLQLPSEGRRTNHFKTILSIFAILLRVFIYDIDSSSYAVFIQN